MSATSEPRLPFDVVEDAGSERTRPTPVVALPDAAARSRAVDPSRNVVLEASAGTGKTRVLVERYVNLLRAGVDPDNILAITFTRKAAAEMRERIIDRLREASRQSALDLARWRDLKDRLGDIAISTIDAFCLSLLREFPLEGDVDPGFELADDTEVPRLVAESLDQALRTCRSMARDDDDVALVFAQLGERRLRKGLELLLDRRLVAPQALRRYLARGPKDLTASVACRAAAEGLAGLFGGVPGGLGAFLQTGPRRHPAFAMLADDISGLLQPLDRLALDTREGQAAFRTLLDRLRGYFLTQAGKPREKSFTGTGFKATDCDGEHAWRLHRLTASDLAPSVAEIIRRFRRDLNVVLSRGVWRIFAVAMSQYQRTLDAHALLDFSGVLERAVRLLREMDEFAQSRFRLETRFRHVLVDEFQDTSRAQWELVAQLVRNWAEGSGAGADALQPSIFIVADRKQSIYAFRDADVAILDEAAAFIDGLRGAEETREAISVSFRAAPELQAFVNDVFESIVSREGQETTRPDAFQYRDQDRFPAPGGAAQADGGRLGLIVGETSSEAADGVAAQVAALLSTATVRDKATGVARRAEPADVAILFRTRDSHREYEKALERRGILTYVYKGLGFFDADEVQDLLAILRYLAEPQSHLRAATLLRSRFVRLSDAAIALLAPDLPGALLLPNPPEPAGRLLPEDRQVLERIRAVIPGWLSQVDRCMPSELLRTVIGETAYAFETRGSNRRQARENIKKLRSMVRRFENRGYATLGRVASHLERLAFEDEANAAIDARDSVSLMTVHAAKGLEFPIVFLVNMGRGTGNVRPAIRVATTIDGEASVSIADYQSVADEDAQAREREETKRLLYVALTRARDYLFLSAAAQKGVFRTTRGSLGEVLPASLKAAFEAAVQRPEGQRVTWSGVRHAHQLSVPRPGR
jgi:ATP-dependent helicase/nuclease subunit A